MFPSTAKGPGEVVDFFAQIVTEHRELPLATIAAQRLAAWDPGTARPLLRDAAKSATDPLERRALALALVHSGEPRAFVRSVLGEFAENRVTLEMLEEWRFRPLAVSTDYG